MLFRLVYIYDFYILIYWNQTDVSLHLNWLSIFLTAMLLMCCCLFFAELLKALW